MDYLSSENLCIFSLHIVKENKVYYYTAYFFLELGGRKEAFFGSDPATKALTKKVLQKFFGLKEPYFLPNIARIL